MHKKFIIKRTLNELLDEMEEAKKDIEGILRTATHIDQYCREHEEIEELFNLVHMTTTIKNQLFLLYKELDLIVQHDKYNELSILERMGEGFENVDIVFED